MSEYPADINLDMNGDPVGRFRANQDPSEADRLHAVPKVNALGEPIMDGDEPVVAMLPLDDPRVAAQLEKEGLVNEGGILVAVEPAEDAPVEVDVAAEVPVA